MKTRKRRTGSAVGETGSPYRSRRKLSASEASRNFSEILNRALYRGESFLVERGGRPVCEIRPVSFPRFTVADLAALMNQVPPIDEDYLREVEEISRSQPTIPGSPWEPS